MARPYTSVDEIKARVGGATMYLQLTDDDNNGTTDSGVESWLQDAVDDLADGYALRGGYSVPLAAADSAFLNGFLLDIANFKLKSRRNKASEDDRQLYKDALAMLEKVATGAITLPSGGSGETGGFANLDFDSEGKAFSRSLLRDM